MAGNRAGINVVRKTSSGPGSRSISNHINRGLITGGSPPTLQRAVVVDIICDFSILTEDYLNFVAQNVDNSEFTDVMPINSIIGRIISNQGGLGTAVYTILFPFWSSHIEMPIKPGEQVYVIYEDYENTGYKVGYWLTRGAAQQSVEDVNYTHFDRRFDSSLNESSFTSQQKINLRSNPLPPIAFNNGGNTSDSLTIAPSGSLSENPYDTIVRNAAANKYVTYEPVPRWRKRPQELVFQGSNNSLIMLGEDRNGPVSGALQQNSVDVKGQAGAVDIVVGRGRFIQQVGIDPRQGAGTANPAGAGSTAPLVATTAPRQGGASQLETDKAPWRTGKLANPLEGDPSPVHDAARIYVVQQSKVDENYRLANGTGITYPQGALGVTQPAGDGTAGRSYVLAKADHIRLVGRKDEVSGINGTVLIIREGQTDTDLGYILINEEGKVQVEASKIYLGKAVPEGEPYIRYTVYKQTIENLQQQLDSIKDCLVGLFDNGGLVTTPLTLTPAITAVPNSPIGALQTIAGLLPGGIAAMNSTVSTNGGDISTLLTDVKSAKIFGE